MFRIRALGGLRRDARPRPPAVEARLAIGAFLRRASRATRVADVTAAATASVAATLIVATALLTADLFYPASGAMRRATLLGLGGLALAVTLGVSLRALAKRPSHRWLARRAETLDPSLEGRLLAVLARLDEPSAAVDALAPGIATRLAAASPRAVVHLKPLRKALAGALAATVLAAGTIHLYGRHAPDRLARALWAEDEPAPPGAPRLLAVRPGAARVIEGGQLDVELGVAGEPGEVALLVGPRHGTSTPRRLVLARAAQGRFTTRLSAIEEDLLYRVELDGHRIATGFPIDVIRAPRVVAVSVRQEFPKYLHLPPREVRGGDVDVPEGTRLVVTAHTSSTPSHGRLRARWVEEGLEETRPLATVATETRTLTGTLDATRGGNYRVEYEDSTGLASRDPRWFSIAVRPDLPPRIEILAPAADREVAYDGSLEVDYEARDDHGLKELALVVAVRGGSPQKISLPCAPGQRYARGKLSLEPRKLGLLPGDTAAYYVAAGDRRLPLANRATSAPFVILVEENRATREALTGLEARDEETIKELAENKTPEEPLESRLERELESLKKLEELLDRAPTDDELAEAGEDPAKDMDDEDLEDLEENLEELDGLEDLDEQQQQAMKPCDDCKKDARTRGACGKCGRTGRCGTCGKPGHGRGCFAPEDAKKMRAKRLKARSAMAKNGSKAKGRPAPSKGRGADMRAPESGELARKYRELLERRRELLRRLAQSVANGKGIPENLAKRLGPAASRALEDALSGRGPRTLEDVARAKTPRTPPTPGGKRALRIQEEIPRELVDLTPATRPSEEARSRTTSPLPADAGEWDEQLPDDLEAVVRAYFKTFGRAPKKAD